MRTAVIDLGTNSFKILISETFSDGTHRTVYKNKIPVNLAEGISSNRISINAFIRGMNALRTFKHNILNYYEVNHLVAYATSGIRSTDNGLEFIAFVEQELGIKIDVISGDREAELVYKGIRNAVPLTKEKALLLDIGGGSAEFIIANKDTIFWKESYKLGASRLFDIFKPSDPISESQIQKLREYIEEEIKGLSKQMEKYKIKTLIGSSGSFNTFGRMVAFMFHAPESYRAHPYFVFTVEEFYKIYSLIISSKLEERIKFEGMNLTRANVIPLSAILVELIIRKYNLTKIIQSQYSLIEGVNN